MDQFPQLPPPRELTVPPGQSAARFGYTEVPASPYTRDTGDREESGGLLEYWRIIRRRKGALILVAFLGALTGVLVTLPQTPVYQARTSLEIQDLNENFMNMKGVSPVSESGSYAALADIQTQIKIIQSESILEAVASTLRIKAPEDFKPQPSRITVWRRALNIPEPPPVAAREAALGVARKNVKARAAGQTRIIEVLVDSTDPTLAADFANTLANQFIDQNIMARWNMTQRTGEFLNRQLDEMRVKLERSEDALQRYAQSANLMFTAEKSSVAEDKLRQLQQTLSAAQSDRITRQSRLELTKASPPEALPDVLNDGSLRNYQEKLTDLRRQAAELAATYTPSHPRVKKIEAQITPLETALQRERAAILKRIQNDFDEAERREKLLTADYNASSQIVSAEHERSIHYNILKREVDSNRQLYDAMLSKVKEASIAAAMRASNVRVIDPAKPPRTAYKPVLSTNAAIGLLAGFFLGLAFVVMRERADRTLQEPGDAAFFLNVPELGVVPSAGLGGRRRSYYLPRAKESDVPALLEEAGKPVDECVELVTWQHRPSLIAEAFRVVVTSILFSGDKSDPPRILVLTSASPREGKTTVVSNLAIALAEIRPRVLVLDGDLRRPRMHDIFGVPNERGLSDLLKQDAASPDDLTGLIHQTALPNLFVLPSGSETSAAATLLHSPNLAALFARLRKSFDMVLIDTPPMLQMPDARVIGRLADGVILVTRTGVTTRDAAVAARHRFNEDNTRVLGAILNYWDPKRSSGGYYGYYKYGYGKAYGYNYYSRQKP
jgi:capsular exopolysaccharide synthesis family protein